MASWQWGSSRIRVGRAVLPLVGAVAVTVALVPVLQGTTEPTSASDETRQTLPTETVRTPRPAPNLAGHRVTSNSPVRVVDRVRTAAPVVFLTIDDGVAKNRSVLRWFRQRQVPATAFLTDANIASDYGYFRRLQRLGVGIQNHTSRHSWLRGSSESLQRDEICSASSRFESEFGIRPYLFRPPFGVWDERTRTAAGRCGIGWMVQWSVVIDGGNVDYRSGFRRLRRGDIVLLHFTRSTTNDLRLFLELAMRSRLRPANLEEYLH